MHFNNTIYKNHHENHYRFLSSISILIIRLRIFKINSRQSFVENICQTRLNLYNVNQFYLFEIETLQFFKYSFKKDLATKYRADNIYIVLLCPPSKIWLNLFITFNFHKYRKTNISIYAIRVENMKKTCFPSNVNIFF